MTDVLKVYGSMIDAARANKTSTQAPVIWIDEVNKLMAWRDKDKDEVDVLLQFFTSTTKQNTRAHVILSTSEYAFVSWLKKDLEFQPMYVTVIGDFSEDAARGFAQYYMDKRRRVGDKAPVVMTDLEWSKVYEVCGGNAVELKAAMRRWDEAIGQEKGVPPTKLLEKALLRVYRPNYLKLETAIKANRTFRFVADRLCTAPYGAICRKDLDAALAVAELGSSEQLIEGNPIAVRPESPLARDLPAEAFANNCDEVATACSAVDLYCLKLLQTEGKLSQPS